MILLVISSFFLCQVLGDPVTIYKPELKNVASYNEESYIGDLINVQTHSWLAAIWLGSKRVCYGSIISKNVVLTVATCVSKLEPKNYRVKVGISSNEEDGSEYEVIAIIRHEGYEPSSFVKNNVALIKVLPFFKFDENVDKITLPEKNSVVATNTAVSIARWGYKGETIGKEKIYMTFYSLFIVKNSECGSTAGLSSSNINGRICAVLHGYDICEDDSGSALVKNGIQIGMIPWNPKCFSSKAPRDYIDIAFYRDWIEQNYSKITKTEGVLDFIETYFVPMFWPMVP